MKHLGLLSVLLALSCGTEAAVTADENILENGTFECDQLPLPWMWSTTSPEFCRGNVSGGPDGLPYLSIGGEAGAPGEVSCRQYGLTLAEGAKYRLSARVRTKGFASKNCGIQIINGGWKKCASAGKIPADTKGEWVRLSHEFVCFPSWNSNYTAVAYAVNSKGTLDVADMRLEALDETARAHSAKPPRDVTTTLPRLVPMTPLLWRIPSDDRAVTFRFFGKLPQGTTADYDVSVRVGEAVSRVPLSLGEMKISVPGTARSGRMSVAVVTRRTESVALEESFSFQVIDRPVVDRAKHRRLNNLCTEILREDFEGGRASWTFSAPRDGWIYVGLRGKGPFAATLDGAEVIATNDCPRCETFRFVFAGRHELSVGGAAGADVIVRSIAEMFSYAPGVNGQVGREPRFDWAFSEKYALPAITTEDGGIIPESARAELRRRGYKWMENFGTPATNVDALVRWFAARPGFTAPQYDGLAYDELFFARPKQIDVFTRAVRAYDLERSPERILRGWTCGKPGSLGLDHAFLSAVVNASRGNGRLQTEVYGRTVATEKGARDFVREYVGGILSGFRQFHPHAVPALSLVFGNFVEPGVISILHHPEVDPKRFLDVELNFAANDPLARDVGGIGWWACNHTDDEICRWSFMLLRHYVVEGRTDMLSDRFGYAYRPDHLLNGDFRGTLDPWTSEGLVTVGYAKGFASASEGRFGIQSDEGDRFAVLTKTNGVAAAIRQTAKNLVPGRLYCLQFAAFDAQDAVARRTASRRFAVEPKLSAGAEIVPELSWVHVDRRQKGYYASNTGVARINVHHLVFRARKAEIEVTLSAADAREGESLGVNWLSLNPYFSRSEQGENWWSDRPEKRADLDSATADLRKRVEALKDGETLTLEKGDCHLFPEGSREMFLAPSGNRASVKRVALPLVGKRNVTIDGNGARFIVHGGVFPFAALGCRGVTLRNCSFKAYEMPLKEFSIVRKDADGFLCQLRDDGVDCKVDAATGRLTFAQELGDFRSDEKLIAVKSLVQRGGTIMLYCGWTQPLPKAQLDTLPARFMSVTAEDRGNGQIYFRRRELPSPHPKAAREIQYEPGNSLAFLLANSRDVDQMFFEGCRDVRVENVRVVNGVGMGVVAQMCENVTFDRYRVAPEGSAKASLTADSIYCVDCSGKIDLADCEIGWGLDDPLNIHGNDTILESVSGSRAVLRVCHYEQRGVFNYRAGERLEFARGHGVGRKVLGEAKVAAFRDPEGPAETAEIVLDREIPAGWKGALVANRSHEPTVTIRDSYFHDFHHLRLYAFGDYLIERNRFVRGKVAAYTDDLAEYWGECGPARRLIVRDNDIGPGCEPCFWLRAPVSGEVDLSGNRFHDVSPDRLFWLGDGVAAPANQCIRPTTGVSRSDDWWRQRFADTRRLAAEGEYPVAFVGDSITHFWETAGRDVWARNFAEGPYRAINFGFCGDLTENVIWRLDEGQFGRVKPKAVVVMIGTNNTGMSPLTGESPLDTVFGIRRILRHLREAYPEATIVWMPIFPRGATKDDPRRIRNDIVNDAVETLVRHLAQEDKKLLICDINARLVDGDGKLSRETMPDLLHPGARGYEIWAEELKPYLDFALGRSAVRPKQAKRAPSRVPVRTAANGAVVPEVKYSWVGDCWNPVKRTHDYRYTQKRLETIASKGETYDLVMVGDSITHLFETGRGKDEWAKLCARHKVLNLGFGGDWTQNALWNVRHGGFLDGVKARYVSLMIGTNNRSHTAEQVADGIRAVVAAIREKQPQAKVLLHPMIPRISAEHRERRAKNDRTNELIRSLADGKDVLWVDLRPIVEGPDVTPEKQRQLLPDGTHPDAEAYSKWREMLEQTMSGEIRLECERFADRGGWTLDSQFRLEMGSSYLLAHGLGKPVADATTSFDALEGGRHAVWVRTKNWTGPWSAAKGAGRFQIIVNGKAVSGELGTEGKGEWLWTKAGEVDLKPGRNTVALHDLTGFDGRCDAICFTTSPSRPSQPSPPSRTFQTVSSDLTVVGGGIAGICTAISAARQGLKVALVQDRPVLGGANSSEVRVHLGGAINLGPYPRFGDLVAEIGPAKGGNAQPAGRYEDDRKLAAVKAEKNITLFLNTMVEKVERVESKVRGEVEGRGVASNVLAAVIGYDVVSGEATRFVSPLYADCTGDGTVGALAGAEFRLGRESRAQTGERLAPEKADQMTMGSSIQWYAQRKVKSEGQGQGRMNFFLHEPWMLAFDERCCSYHLRGDWDWETGMMRDQLGDFETVRDYGLLVVYSNWGYVKNLGARKNEMKDAALAWVAHVAGKRETRRLVGDVVLSERDIMDERPYPDATCCATWAIDLHYPMPSNGCAFAGEPFRSVCTHDLHCDYPIPYRCFYSKNVANLFMAGRDISVTHVALGTTRVMRTHGMMGEVVGMAAAVCRKYGCDPRGVYTDHLDDLRARMTKGVGLGQPQPPQKYNVSHGEERTFCADPAAFFEAAVARGAKKVRLPKAFYHLTPGQDRRIAALQTAHPDVTFDYAGSEFGGSTAFLKNFTPVLRAKVEALKDGETLTLEKGEYHLYSTDAREMFLAPSGTVAGVKRVAMPLVGKRNVTIDGGGSRFIVHGDLYPFAAVGSAGVTFRNCSFESHLLPIKDFSVIAKDPEGFLCQMSSDGPDYEVDSGWKRLFFHLERQTYRSDGRVITIRGSRNPAACGLVCGWHRDDRSVKDGLAMPFMPTRVEDRGNGRLYFRFVKDDHPKAVFSCPYAVGDLLSMQLLDERTADRIVFVNCTAVTVVGVTVDGRPVEGWTFAARPGTGGRNPAR